MRLRTSLGLLAAATAAPLVAFALLAANLVIEQENDGLANAAKTRNRATMTAVDGVVRDAINTLKALAVTPSLEQGDLEDFYVLSRKVLATQSAWDNVLLHDATGRQLVNASLVWGAPLLDKPVAPQSIRQAVETGVPAVDSLAVAPRLDNRLGIPVRVPVLRDNKVVYVLTAVIRPDAFQRLLAAQEMPAGWVSGLVDKDGRFIARIPEKPPGSLASADYVSHMRAGGTEGWYRGKTLEGYDAYTAFLRSELTGWSLGYALPASLVTGRWGHAGWLISAGAILSLVAALSIGLWLSRRIATPISQLSDAANSIATRTSAPSRIESTIREINTLSTAFDAAAVGLFQRDQELRRSEGELRQQASELRRANANKSQFLALLAHELRNPLAPLRTGLAILAREPDAHRARETRAMMARQVAHMARLIDDLLDMSRIDRGVLELRRERMAIDSVVRDTVEAVKPELDAKHQDFVVRYPPTQVYVDGDSARLSQILSNLLSNACKFTPAGGHIELATKVEGDEVVITVVDDGIGFMESERQRIFDMFVQLDASRSQSTAGLGLGLTIVRSLVEMHGGQIEARSAGPGKGATFTVRLPTAPSPAAPHVLAAPEHGPGSQRRILVVDDNIDAANSLSEMLRLDGYEVGTAYDGLQGLELARSFRPEVAFVDLNMPRMGGLDLARVLRSEPWAGMLRLVAVTGMARQSDIDATRAAGFDAHLAKPVSPDDIARLAAGAPNVIPLRGGRSSS